MILLTYVLFPVLLQRVAGEASEDQPQDEAAPSHFDLQADTSINRNSTFSFTVFSSQSFSDLDDVDHRLEQEETALVFPPQTKAANNLRTVTPPTDVSINAKWTTILLSCIGDR